MIGRTTGSGDTCSGGFLASFITAASCRAMKAKLYSSASLAPALSGGATSGKLNTTTWNCEGRD